MTQSFGNYDNGASHSYHILTSGFGHLNKVVDDEGPNIRMSALQGTPNEKQLRFPTHILAISTPKYYISH